MFINNFDPVAFQVFSFEIRWYSLAYIVGLIIGWIYCNKFLIKDQEKKNQFDDYITCLLYTSPSPRDRQKSRMPSSA